MPFSLRNMDRIENRLSHKEDDSGNAGTRCSYWRDIWDSLPAAVDFRLVVYSFPPLAFPVEREAHNLLGV